MHNKFVGEKMKNKSKIIKVILSIFFVGLIVVAIFLTGVIISANKIKFDRNKLITANQEITVLDANDAKLENKIINKNLIEIDKLNLHTINAFVSIEDKQFFEHKGLNYKRIAKAMLNNIKAGSFKEGASTISQQLIKNTHLSSEKTIARKINEIILTKKLENEFSKKDILETYLNVIYFGENCYGIESASKTFFGKSASQLNLSESATLAGIIKSPYTYSPIHNKDNCEKRRNIVLKEMLDDKKITQAQYDDAITSGISIVKNNDTVKANDLYIKACLSEAAEILNLSEKEIRISGIKIFSYLDDDKQKLLQDICNNVDNYHKNSYGNINDSLSIIIDNKTCGIVAFAGKSEYDLVNFARQPGSAIKPALVYAPALENGTISPQTLILDEEVDFGGYSPKNVGNTYSGYVSVEESICESLNIPAVKILDYIGVKNAKKFAQNIGINFDKSDNGLALALGGFTTGVNLKTLTNSYLPFVNKGKYSTANFVRKIEDSNGKTLYEHLPENRQVMGEDSAFLMTDMLSKACDYGTSKKLKTLNFDVAGKTGTVAIKGTNNNTDAYSIAYTTQHTMGVWIGNYSNQPEYVMEGKNNGGTFATNIIKQCFEKIYAENVPSNFEMPESVQVCEVDFMEYENNKVLKLASRNCPDRYKFKALFSKRYIPSETSKLFENLSVSNFNVELNNGNALITFDAVDYLKYDICRVENGVSKVIRSISNKNNKIEYYDTSIKPNKKYGYYINISTIDGNANATSETLNIITEKEESKVELDLIINKNKNNDISWIFG